MVLSPNQILRHFYRAGGNGKYTKPIEDFPPETQNSILKILAGFSSQSPLIASWRSPCEWLFVMSDRIVFSTETGHQEILYDAIVSVRPTQQEGMDLEAAKMTLFGDSTRSSLTVDVNTGENYAIRVEDGPAAAGLWHALSRVS